MLDKNAHERLIKFSQFIVPHISYTHAIETIERAISATATTNEPMSAMLTGLSGTGKTAVCRYLLKKMPPRESRQEDDGITQVVPAFYCGVPAEVTIKGLAAEMLNKLGSDDIRGDRVALERRLFHLLATCKTEVIFLDEFHHLLVRGAEKARATVCEWVKTLMNETGVPVILVGMPNCEAIVDEHPQLARRYPYRAHMISIRYSSGDQSEFLKILKAFGKAMNTYAGIENVVPLTDLYMASAIYVATGGNMNSIRQLLYEVVHKSLERGGEMVVREDFVDAFSSIRLENCLLKKRINPFLMEQNELLAAIAQVS